MEKQIAFINSSYGNDECVFNSGPNDLVKKVFIRCVIIASMSED